MPYQQPRVPIGRRREKIAIQEPLTMDDGMGGETLLRWQTMSEPWAQVAALDERDKEALAALKITAKHGYHVTIPYKTGITQKHRRLVRNVPMEIHTLVDDEGRRRRLVIQCGEIQ